MSFLCFDQIIAEKCAKIKKNYGFRGGSEIRFA